MEGKGRLLVVLAAITVVGVLLLGGYLAVGGLRATHELTIKSIPGDLKLTLDGTEIPATGTIEVKEGRHQLVGERRGFEKYAQEFDVQADRSIKVYLNANSAEGEAWEKAHPDEVLEQESEASRAHDEHDAEMIAKYPLIGHLPFSGNGFTMYYDQSEAHPDDPEQLAFYVQLRVPEAAAKPEVERWIRTTGEDPAKLELIYLPPK